MMKVLFVAAEGAPFSKTGGLGDVIGSLPKELKKQGVDVRVILPKYGDIPARFTKEMTFIKDMIIPVGWRKQFCGVQQLEYEGVTFYFIDNEYYFKRSGLYGFFDEAERYAFFCRGTLAVLPEINFQPDIIHCHDWHTGMVSVLLHAEYRHNSFYENMATCFTIHNLMYQGIFSKTILGDLLSLGNEYFTPDKLEFKGDVNFMKGGIVFSDLVTTVSKTYAEEIQTPYYGENLDGLLRARSKELYGIVNGIDYGEYNPAEDRHIFVPYTWQKTNKHQENKTRLQAQLGLPIREEVPLLAIVSRLVDAKGMDLIAHILEELLAMDIQLVVLGTGQIQYHKLFADAAAQYPDKVSANLVFDNILAHKIYAGSDLFLMPSRFEPCGIGQMIAMRYGSLPIVRETGGLKDTVIAYNEVTGEGTGFSFAHYNAHDMLYTIQRAIGLFPDKEVWGHIVKNAMQQEYGWTHSVKVYQELYQQLLQDRGLDNTE